MNIADVEELGRLLQDRSRDLEALASGIETRIRASSWQGVDADRFRNDWWPKHRAKLLTLGQELAGLGQSALNNASAQRAASDDAADQRPSGSPSMHLDVEPYLQPRDTYLGGGGEADYDDVRNLLETAEDIQFIADAYRLTTGELDEVVRVMKEGGTLSAKHVPFAGAVVSAALGGAEIGLNAGEYGWGDGRTMWSQVDTAASIVLTPIPGGGMAWSLGTKVGEGLAVGGDHLMEHFTGDTYGGHLVNNKLNELAGGDFEALSPEQQSQLSSELVARYEGWSGFRNFVVDSLTW